MKLAIITPTRNRLYTLSLLHKYVSRQTRKPDLWIVATDGKKPVFTDTDIETIVSAEEYAGTPRKSFATNLLRCIDVAEENNVDAVIVMEDDDWYSPHYVEKVTELLPEANVVALTPFRELRVISGEQSVVPFAPLAQLSFTKEVFPVFRSAVQEAYAKESFKVDHIFWRMIKEKNISVNQYDQSGLIYCLKGVYFAKKSDSKGLTSPHTVYRRTLKGYCIKALHGIPAYKKKLRIRIFEILRSNIGEDAEAYREIIWGKVPTDYGEF